jgi:hypothetical protein
VHYVSRHDAGRRLEILSSSVHVLYGLRRQHSGLDRFRVVTLVLVQAPLKPRGAVCAARPHQSRLHPVAARPILKSQGRFQVSR